MYCLSPIRRQLTWRSPGVQLVTIDTPKLNNRSCFPHHSRFDLYTDLHSSTGVAKLAVFWIAFQAKQEPFKHLKLIEHKNRSATATQSLSRLVIEIDYIESRLQFPSIATKMLKTQENADYSHGHIDFPIGKLSGYVSSAPCANQYHKKHRK